MAHEICHTDDCCVVDLNNADGEKLKAVLFVALFINFGMFAVEIVSGLMANSNPLIAVYAL